METCELLRQREVRGIVFQSQPRLFVERDGFFMYVDDREVIRTFDSVSQSTTVLPPRDKKIQGYVLAFDFSPARNLALVSYSDGSVQLFDLETNKPGKIIIKQHSPPVSVLAFVTNTLVLVAEANNLSAYKITQALGLAFMTSARGMLIAEFKSHVKGIYVPPVYKYVDGVMRSLFPKFEERVFVSTEKSVFYARIDQSGIDFAFCDAKSEEISNGKVAFWMMSSDEMRVAISGDRLVHVFNVAEKVVEKGFSKQIDCEPSILSFISSNILAAFDDRLAARVITLNEQAVSNIKCPIRVGHFAKSHELYVFDNVKLWKLSVPSFTDEMVELLGKGDIESAVVLSRRALTGDPTVGLGLPVSEAQRSLLIERLLSDLLSNTVRSRLQTQPAEEVGQWIVSLSLELHLMDWVIIRGISLFNECGKSAILFKEILQRDPHARVFNYTEKFVDILLEHDLDLDVLEFVSQLPSSVVKLSKLLEYGMRKNDIEFVTRMYLRRTGRVSDVLTILANATDMKNVCRWILEQEIHLSEAIVWIFSVKDGEFPNIERIVEEVEEETSMSLFSLIANHIENEEGTKMCINDFVNALLIGTRKLSNLHPLVTFVQTLVRDRKSAINPCTLKLLLHRIFTTEVPKPDKREALLLYVLSCNIPVELKAELLPLCDIYKFQEAKIKIQREAKNFDNAVFDLIYDMQCDVIAGLRALLLSDPEAINSVRNGVIKEATVIAMRDSKELSIFCREFLKDEVVQILLNIHDERTQLIFMHEMLKFNEFEFAGLELPENLIVSYGTFLCEHYPSEMRVFVPYHKELMGKFLPICERYDVFDACAVICNIMNAIDRAAVYFSRYIETQLVLMIKKQRDADISDTASFIASFTDHVIRSQGSTSHLIDFCNSVIRAFVVPLYALKQNDYTDELCHAIIETIKRVCVSVTNVVPFETLLETIVVEYQEIDFGFMRSAILAVMRDYDYDVDQNSTMSLLYHNDEGNAHAKYIKQLVHGILYKDLTCSTCHHGIFGCSSPIHIFPCGHTFHKTKSCLPNEICPQCNPEVRIEQYETPKLHNLPSSTMRSKLTKFEFMLSKKENSQLTEDHVGNIVLSPISVFPA